MAKTSKSRAKKTNELGQQRQSNIAPFHPKSDKQKDLYHYLLNCNLVIATGPAGTGKSFVEASAAMRLYMDGEIDRIIVLRNPLPTGNSLGFFPGTEGEKLAVWCQPIMDTFKKVIHNDALYQYLMNKQLIQFDSIETLKGTSWDNTFIIVEEAQECPMEVLMMLSTRIGENSIICFNGDIRQKNSKLKTDDFKNFVESIKAYDAKIDQLLEEGVDLPEWQRLLTPIIEFDKDDIVRSDLCRKMVEIFYT